MKRNVERIQPIINAPVGIPLPENPPGIPNVPAPILMPTVVTNWVFVRTSAGAGQISMRFLNQQNENLTNGGEETTIRFVVKAYHVLLQNNTQVGVNWEIDSMATPGSPIIAAGQTLFLDTGMDEIHLWTAAQQLLNGGAPNNIVVRAWA